MGLKKVAALFAAAAIAFAGIPVSAETLPERSGTSGKIRFDPGDWESSSICFYIWDATEEPLKFASNSGWIEENTWASRKKTAGTKLTDGTFESFEFEIPEGHDIYVIFFDPDTNKQTYDCVLTADAFGDTARRTGKKLENPVDDEKKADEVRFENSGLTARLCFTSSGKIQGSSITPNMDCAMEVAQFIGDFTGLLNKTTLQPIVTRESIASAISQFHTTADEVWRRYLTLKDSENLKGVYNEAIAQALICPTGYTPPDENGCKERHNYTFMAATWIGNFVYPFNSPYRYYNYTKVKAVFMCENDPTHMAVIDAKLSTKMPEPQCESYDMIEYTAEFSYEGKDYKMSTYEILPPVGHDYGEPTWNWISNSNVEAVFPCARDGSHTRTVPAQVTRKVNFEDGSVTLTAKASIKYTYRGVNYLDQYSDTRTVFLTDSDTDINTNDTPDSDTDSDEPTDTDSDSDEPTDTDSDSDEPTDTDSDSDEEAPIAGDADGDGDVTSADALMILRGSSGLSQLTDVQIAVSDVDGDGDVTSSDALQTLRYSSGLPASEGIGKRIA